MAALQHLTRRAGSPAERLSAMVLLSLAKNMTKVERENTSAIIRIILDASLSTVTVNGHSQNQDIVTADKSEHKIGDLPAPSVRPDTAQEI
jgi:hypothetical protein